MTFTRGVERKLRETRRVHHMEEWTHREHRKKPSRRTVIVVIDCVHTDTFCEEETSHIYNHIYSTRQNEELVYEPSGSLQL
jgi:hypothetical protein